MICILLAFVTGAAFIIEKHKEHESMRRKIAGDILILAITLLLAVLLGGMASRFAANVTGAYVEVRWQGLGMAAGFIAAILVSFAVGYAANRAAGKLSRE
jgi:protein-S-isoprenylcysteine O-methyltransferase Ste14